MRTVLLASALALAPGLATAQHCTAPAEASAGASPRGTAPPPGLPTPSKPVLPPEQVEATPALRALAARGAELFDLGVRHGLRGVFARAADKTSFQVFYLTPDGEGVVAGEMFDLAAADPGARRVTLEQVRGIPGVVPTVDLRRAPGPTPPEAHAVEPAADVNGFERTAHGLVGRDGAPRVWMFFDPLCPHSAAAMDQLRPAVASGEVQVALVPVPLLDPTGSRPNTTAALALLSGPHGAMDAAWAGIVGEVRARRPLPAVAGFPAGAKAAVDTNRAVAHRLAV